MGLIQVSIEDEQLAQLKHLAVDKGTNVSQIIRAAVSAILLEEAT